MSCLRGQRGPVHRGAVVQVDVSGTGPAGLQGPDSLFPEPDPANLPEEEVAETAQWLTSLPSIFITLLSLSP